MSRRLLMLPALGAAALQIAVAPVLAASPLANLALQTADLPAGFKRTSGHITGNQVVAISNRLPISTLTSHGRVSGYVATFVRLKVKQGMYYASDEVDQYRSAAGATWWYDFSVGQAGAAHYSRVAAAGVGDASQTLSIVQLSGKKEPISTTTYVTVFRQGSYVANVGITGRTNTISPGLAVHYARIMDARIRTNG
jgi:hypothetical protein